jgi:multiple sugar transport system ATP-binding protein
MRTELQGLQRSFKQTVVYVTHDQLEAMAMADRIAVMDHGVLQQVGTPLQIYNDPAKLFVARFIGSPGMNLSHGRPTEVAARWRLIRGLCGIRCLWHRSRWWRVGLRAMWYLGFGQSRRLGLVRGRA